VSIWYHAVRVGTYDHVVVQSTVKSTLGIWVHVSFPSGMHHSYFENTDRLGHWEKTFSVPPGANSIYTNRALVTFQLWRAKKTVKDFLPFYLVR
jgi:hypothetical protein